ncbi:imidazolonepropionase [Proteinivorax hydrogeniformans]|uniref:Imidazolonepropionase n=1 Tax=Proteinivorax hydrogeniformans TaxID=1826727 RepID=A0AAU8HTC0_9FIRM
MEKIVIKNGNIVTMAGFSHGPQKGEEFGKLGLIEDGAIVISDGVIEEVGPTKDIEIPNGAKVFDVKGRLVTPGLIDPHTHLAHFGSREKEYTWRIEGMPYIEILKNGGGILETVRQNRIASEGEIFNQSLENLSRMISFGVTTVESKSGYGLDWETELKQLKTNKRLEQETNIDVVSTFLGAHAIPTEFKEDPEEFVQKVIEMLPKAKEYATYCDVFCEEGVFTPDQSERILLEAKKLGYKVKLHADEIVATGGAQLAAKLGADSADHLLCVDDEGMNMMAEKEVVAVLLPGTSFNLMSDKYAPAQSMIEKQVPIALATDFNPGSCPTENPQLVMTLACLNLKLTPSQALAAFTINAAHSVGMGEKVGSIEEGKQGDVVVFDCPNVDYIPYRFGINHTHSVFKKGKLIWQK